MFGDEFEEYRARSYSGGMLPEDNRKRAFMRCMERKQHSGGPQKTRQPTMQKTVGESPQHLHKDNEAYKECLIPQQKYDENHIDKLDTSELRPMKQEIAEQLNFDAFNDWNIGDQRPRVYSMPTQRRRPPLLQHAWSKHRPLHRLRSFTISAAGQVDRGPVYVSSGSDMSLTQEESSSTQQLRIKVGITGDIAVGKSSIIRNFIASDAQSSVDTSTGKT